MKVAIVTDAWRPQMNGVVRTLEEVTGKLAEWGHELLIISPDRFRSIPCPTYPEIRLALVGRRRVGAMIDDFAPDALHIATEGPLGLAARRHALSTGRNFTTAYHTQFPDYVARRTGLSPRMIWPYIRWFHSPAQHVMVATETMREQLRGEGLARLWPWSRGVDLANFAPDAPPPSAYAALERPIQLYAGRVAVEKNIEAFLKTRHPGSKVVVGDGPALDDLKRKYPGAHFAGRRTGRDLAGYYAGADLFVFPSKTDTFGLVMIEALACGTPVAAYPVTGPTDVLTPETGAMREELEDAIGAALTLDRAECARYGTGFTWEASARQFLNGLVPAEEEALPDVRLEPA